MGNGGKACQYRYKHCPEVATPPVQDGKACRSFVAQAMRQVMRSVTSDAHDFLAQVFLIHYTSYTINISV